MRVMILMKANKNSEAGVFPSEQVLTQMGNFNEELVKAGIMQAGEGLHPSSKGARVRFSGGQQTVVDGPFSETKELLAGFWMWKVKSMDEALNDDFEVELRPVFEMEDFGDEFTPEARAQEERLRAELEAKK
jgi:hypothetical protein